MGMVSAVKSVVRTMAPRWLCPTVLGLACCLVSLGTFGWSLGSYADVDFYGVRITTDPFSGGLPIIAACAVAVLVACRARVRLRPTKAVGVALALASAVGVAGLFAGGQGGMPQAVAEAGGALLTFAGIASLVLWAQLVAPRGLPVTLTVSGLALLLVSFCDLVVRNALVDAAGMAVLSVMVVASPVLLALAGACPAERAGAEAGEGGAAGAAGHAPAGGEVATVSVAAAPASALEVAPAPDSASQAQPAPSRPCVIPLGLSLACVLAWGVLMGRVQSVGNSAQDASGLLAFIIENAAGLSALAVAVLCLVASGMRRAFGVARITVLAMLACSVYFSGTFGVVSIPVGMFAMGTARMTAFVYLWMLACRLAEAPDCRPAGANGPAFIVAAGWGLFTAANTASTRVGLAISPEGTWFVVYNILIMACLAGLIVLEFLPTRAALASLDRAGATDMDGGEAPAASPVPAPTSEELLAMRCDELAGRFSLTEREREVLAPLVRGRSASSIASQLSMSTETARTHIRHIYQKVDVHSREELMDLFDASEEAQA